MSPAAAKRTTIRRKLFLALAVPVTALLLVTVIDHQRAADKLAEVGRDNAIAVTAVGPGSLARAIQVERNDMSVTLLGLRKEFTFAAKDAAGSAASTTRILDQFEATVSRGGPQIEALYGPSLRTVRSELATLQQRFSANQAKPTADQTGFVNDLFVDFSATIERLLAANAQVTAGVGDGQLRNGTITLDAIGQFFEQWDDLARATTYSQATGGVIGNEANRTVVQRGLFGLKQAKARLEQGPKGAWDAALPAVFGPEYRRVIALVDRQLDTGELDIAETFQAFGTLTTPVNRFAAQVDQAITSRAAALHDRAQQDQESSLAIAVAAVLGALVVAVAAARSVSKPLAQLAKDARSMASEHLPRAVRQVLDTPPGQDVDLPHLAPITVASRDEVQDVGAALDHVQRVALDLAVEQALLGRNVSDSFANLGRRTHDLISRQLDLISDLEVDEADPTTLDALFKLDHLTTRALRNAESLVVLAGVETPRTSTEPISMLDVVRSALGEVEDYQRVQVEAVDLAHFPGTSAADLVHLLAELIENGLTFSPADRPVEVTGVRTGDSYVVVVIDEGPGMTNRELATANQRLAGAESFTIAPSRYLGHYVAGRLAARIGVTITVDRTTDGGLLAKVRIPTSLLVEPAPQPARPEPVRPSGPTPVLRRTVGQRPVAAVAAAQGGGPRADR